MLIKAGNRRNPKKQMSNFIKNKLNYKSARVGLLSGNLANFATLGGCNLARNPLFQVFFAVFFMLA